MGNYCYKKVKSQEEGKYKKQKLGDDKQCKELPIVNNQELNKDDNQELPEYDNKKLNEDDNQELLNVNNQELNKDVIIKELYYDNKELTQEEKEKLTNICKGDAHRFLVGFTDASEVYAIYNT